MDGASRAGHVLSLYVCVRVMLGVATRTLWMVSVHAQKHASVLGYELKRAHSLSEQLRQVKVFTMKLYSKIKPGASAEKLEVENFIVFEKTVT